MDTEIKTKMKTKPIRYGALPLEQHSIALPPALWERLQAKWRQHDSAKSVNDFIAITLMEQHMPELLAK